MIALRDYQSQAIEKIREAWTNENAVLLTCATGGGKTAIFLSLLHQVLGDNKRAIVLAHRQELIFQPRDRMVEYYPEWQGRIGVTMGEYREVGCQITIATIQTLSSGKRLDEVLAAGKIDYLIVDEAHHTSAETYTKLVARLFDQNPALKILGVTATPIRADGDGLGKVFKKEAARYGIQELIKSGWLVPVRWLGIQVGISLDSVKTVAGDFQKKELANVYEVDNCFDLVVETHQRYAADRQAIAFTVSVEGAYRLAEKFRAAGINAVAADGTTDKKDRMKILDGFYKKEYQVLCNVGLYTEGLDVPEVSCIHQVRPTRSDGLYIQMIGRALRKFPGKQDALILDYCPADSRNIVLAGDVLGKEKVRKDAYIKNEVEIGDAVGGFTFDGEYEWMAGSPADIIAKQLNYMDLSTWTWYRADDGTMSINLGKASDDIDRTLFITAPEDGQVILFGIGKTSGGTKVKKILVGDIEKAIERAEQTLNVYGSTMLCTKKKGWRKEPASEAQVKFARRLGVYKPGISKGDQADMITHALARSAVNLGQ